MEALELLPTYKWSQKMGFAEVRSVLEVTFELKASSEVAFQVRNLVQLFHQTQLDVLDGPLNIWMAKSTCVEDLNLTSSMIVTT